MNVNDNTEPQPTDAETLCQTAERPVDAHARQLIERWHEVAREKYGDGEPEAAEDVSARMQMALDFRDRLERQRMLDFAAQDEEERRRSAPESQVGWETAIAALLGNLTIKAASQQSGISLRTYSRLMANPAFVERYRAAQNRVIDDAVDRHRDLRLKAAERLGECLKDGDLSLALRAVLLVYKMSGHTGFTF